MTTTTAAPDIEESSPERPRETLLAHQPNIQSHVVPRYVGWFLTLAVIVSVIFMVQTLLLLLSSWEGRHASILLRASVPVGELLSKSYPLCASFERSEDLTVAWKTYLNHVYGYHTLAFPLSTCGFKMFWKDHLPATISSNLTVYPRKQTVPYVDVEFGSIYEKNWRRLLVALSLLPVVWTRGRRFHRPYWWKRISLLFVCRGDAPQEIGW